MFVYQSVIAISKYIEAPIIDIKSEVSSDDVPKPR